MSDDYQVKKVELPADRDKRLALGHKLFTNPYTNLFICSKKKSGKTNLIYNILDQCADKRTTVLFFCSKLFKDDMYKSILNMLDAKGIGHIDRTSFIEHNRSVLNDIMITLDQPVVEAEEKPPIVKRPTRSTSWITERNRVKAEHKHSLAVVGSTILAKKKTKKKRRPRSKFIAPELIMLFDDLSSDLRHADIAKLVKNNRHYKCMTIFSSQWMTDLMPASIRQMDVVILFHAHTRDKLEAIYMKLDLNVTLEQFYDMYDIATSSPFNFLYIDVSNCDFRHNFSKIILNS